jgi:hypothetical protein
MTAPLSFAQLHLWRLAQADAGGVEHLVSWAWRVRGPLDVDVLCGALARVADRHEVLRTAFRTVGGEPVQVVAQRIAVPLRVVEVGGRQPGAWVSEELKRPFELSAAPLWRVLAVRCSPTDHVLNFVWHHLVIDAWSAGILTRELSACYRTELTGAQPDLPQLKVHYRDLARVERECLDDEMVEEQLVYWRNQLAAVPSLLLPTDRTRRSSPSQASAAVGFVVPPQVADGLRQLAIGHRATLFMVLLAAVKVLLARYAKQDDVAVGTPLSRRRQVDSEPLIGYFLDTLVLRTDLSGDPSFAALLRRVREVALDAYEFDELPFERIQVELGAVHNPMYRVRFLVNTIVAAEWDLPDIKVEDYPVPDGPAGCDLTVAFGGVSAELSGYIRYRTELFDQVRIDGMCADLVALLAAVSHNPDRRLSELTLLCH